MIAKVWTGTPNHLETDECSTPALAKAWLKRKIKPAEKWASRFNLELESDLREIRFTIDSINFAELPVGQDREWRASDEHSGVIFVYGTRVVSR